jgi:hypothetical protein
MRLIMVIEVPELQGASLERLSGSDNHSVESVSLTKEFQTQKGT